MVRDGPPTPTEDEDKWWKRPSRTGRAHAKRFIIAATNLGGNNILPKEPKVSGGPGGREIRNDRHYRNRLRPLPRPASTGGAAKPLRPGGGRDLKAFSMAGRNRSGEKEQKGYILLGERLFPLYFTELISVVPNDMTCQSAIRHPPSRLRGT